VVRGAIPGEFEQVVLLALASVTGEASGRQVYEAVMASTGRDASVAAVHITLARLADKGWATVTTAPPAPHEGGKPRKRYALSSEGAAMLARQRAQLDALWERAARNPLLGGEGG
jgi:DNA-binding PadR family transcriptional regulator